MQQQRAGLGAGLREVPHSGAVHRGGRLLGALGAVDVRPGGAVDDHLVSLDRGAHGGRVGDVQVGAPQRGHLRLGVGAEHRQQVAAEHPPRRSPASSWSLGQCRLRLERLPPVAVVAVPGDGGREAVLEAHLRGVAELLADLADVDRVAQVVALAVLDVARPSPARTGQRPAACRSAPCWWPRCRRRCCRPRRRGRRASTSSMPRQWSATCSQSRTLRAVAVQRDLAAVDQVGGEERDDLLGELVVPVVVGAAGHRHVHAVRAVVGQREQVGGRLGGGVRASWAAAATPRSRSPR